MTVGIYQILHRDSNKRYIGSSINVLGRLREHRYNLNANTHSNKYLQASWNKYGKYAFDSNLILECRKEDLLFYEDSIIKGYNSNKRESGFNLREVTESNAGILPFVSKNKPGEVFNRLTLIKPAGMKSRRRLWLCQCSCGTQREFCLIDVRKGHTKSCGCIQTERQRAWLIEQHKKGPWNKKEKLSDFICN